MEPDKPTQPASPILNRPISRHPSEDKLELYALGRLAEPEVEEIEIHLLVCETCQDALTATDQYVAAMRGALSENPIVRAAPAQSKSWMSWRPMPAFSMALAALSVAVVVSYQFYPSHQPEPAGVILRSVRGGQETAEGPANMPLNLTIESEQLKVDSSYRAEIVDAGGAGVWKGTPDGGPHGGMIKTDKALKPGSYWVRLRDANGNLLQEYGLHLK